MAMRIDIGFAQGLDADGRVRLQLALGVLPQVHRIAISPNGSFVTVYAGEMALVRIREVLAEAGLVPARVGSGLTPEADAELQPPEGERVRPIGR
jgi:hypothetical protein